MFERQEAPADSVVDMVGHRALQLLEVEGDERQERYEVMKEQMFWSAIEDGMPRSDAWDMSEKVGQWTLDLVDRVIATGGARGGQA